MRAMLLKLLFLDRKVLTKTGENHKLVPNPYIVLHPEVQSIGMQPPCQQLHHIPLLVAYLCY